MPLTEATPRREIHHRTIDMRTYAREDGLYDVEAHLVDRKAFPYYRISRTEPIPAGQALHDFRIRMTVDGELIVREITATSDVTPWELCKEAATTVSALVGEQIGRGWGAKVREHLRGAASCTHLMELLVPMATTALQGIRGLRPERPPALDENGVPKRLDSCYAYGRRREIVKRLWPQHYEASDALPDSPAAI
jgi:hypothetical protein